MQTPDPTHHLPLFIPTWVPDAVFYQIFPDRFCNGSSEHNPPHLAAWNDIPTRENFFGGNLQGIANKLDYLQNDLGINALYLNPIFQAKTNHKYDTINYFRVDPAFGSNNSLKHLVKEVHQRGMHIILDGVFNHCGSMFPPFQDVVKNGEASSYKDWFQVRNFPVNEEPLNYLTCGGATYLPKFNHAYRPVQDFILQVGRFWLEEIGIDGWRLDVPFKIPLDFWREFRTEMHKVNPQAYLVGEVWREAEAWVQGDIFDGVTNYRLRELILDYCLTKILDGEDFAFETEMLNRAHGQAANAMFNLLGSHDTTRVLTLLRGDTDQLNIALTYLMTNPGVPMIYYGDEVGLLGETDPDCRRTMPWNPDKWNPRIFEIHRRLIALRKEHPALRRGERTTLFFFNGVFAYYVSSEHDEIIVVLNPRESVPNSTFSIPGSHPAWKDISNGQLYIAQNGIIDLGHLSARSALVLLPA